MVAVRARGIATRQKFIDAAVELFDEVGYGITGLNDIADRAGVARGVFYYYFPSKESVAAAIFEQADDVVSDALVAVSAAAPSPLERLIRFTFVVADLTQNHKLVRVGNRLRQSLTQVSPAAHDTFDLQRRVILVAVTRKAIAAGELLDDVDPDALGHSILIGLLGARLLSDATGEDVAMRLGQVWTTILRGAAAPESREHYRGLVETLCSGGSR